MKAFAVKSNAKVNSTQTCDGGDAKVSCREKHCHFSWQTCGEGIAKVSCCGAQRAQGAVSAKVSCSEALSMKMISMMAVFGNMVVRCIVRALLAQAVRR